MNKAIERLRVMRVIARMNIGGPALQAAVLARELDATRYEHRLYTGSVAPGEADYLRLCAPDVEATRVPGLGRAVNPLDDARALADLTRAMRRFRPHIVHTHTAKAGTLGRLAALAAGAPVVTGAPNIKLGDSGQKVILGLAGTSYWDGHATPKQIKELKPTQLRGVPSDAMVMSEFELGLSDEHEGIIILPPDAPVVAYVGRVTRVKRPDRLLAAARAVLRSIPQTHFAICGEGESLSDLTATPDPLPGLHLLGWRADVETVYAAADVVILTSDNEGMPVSLIEAALAGVPVVATRVGSVAEVVRDGVTGLLCEPDADELGHSVVRLLRDATLREQMGAAARDYARSRFEARRLVSDMDRLYTSIAVRHGWWPRQHDRRAEVGEP